MQRRSCLAKNRIMSYLCKPCFRSLAKLGEKTPAKCCTLQRENSTLGRSGELESFIFVVTMPCPDSVDTVIYPRVSLPPFFNYGYRSKTRSVGSGHHLIT